MPDGDWAIAAYLIFLALILIYVAIMGVRLRRLEHELSELDEMARRRDAAGTDRDREPLA